MKVRWTQEELVERWTLFPDELALVANRTCHTRLGFAVMLRFFAGEGRFPRDKHEVPAQVLGFVGEQVEEPAGPETGPERWLRYDWSGRSVKYHRAQIREFFGFREATVQDGEDVASWLLAEVLPKEQDTEKLREAFCERCRALKIGVGGREVKVAIQLCRELRYPEQWRHLAGAGAEVFVYMTNAVGDAGLLPVWRSHLVSRAAENQRFVLSANDCRPGQKCLTMAVDPGGIALWEAVPDSAGTGRTELDLSRSRDWYIEQARTDVVECVYRAD